MFTEVLSAASGLSFILTEVDQVITVSFLPRDARSASAVLLSYVVRLSVRPSVCLSVCNVDVP